MPEQSFEEFERAIVQRSLDEMAAGRYAGYLITDLDGAFKAVQDKENWKMPVDAVVPADADQGLIHAAIAFYTGSMAEFSPVAGGWRVEALGYYACIGS